MKYIQPEMEIIELDYVFTIDKSSETDGNDHEVGWG